MRFLSWKQRLLSHLKMRLNPARKNRVIAVLVVLSMALSFACSRLPGISALSGGTRIILLTVVIAAAAALIRPVKAPEPDPNFEGGEAP